MILQDAVCCIDTPGFSFQYKIQISEYLLGIAVCRGDPHRPAHGRPARPEPVYRACLYYITPRYTVYVTGMYHFLDCFPERYGIPKSGLVCLF